MARPCYVSSPPTAWANLKSTLTYSEDTGLLETTETRDTTNPDAQQQSVTLCTQHNDSLGRETRRTLSVNGQVRQLVNVWLDNDMLHSRTLWQGEQKLREETFEYDDLGRLTKYDCPVQTTSGRQIKTQIFRFDAVDNVKRCRTTFNEGEWPVPPRQRRMASVRRGWCLQGRKPQRR